MHHLQLRIILLAAIFCAFCACREDKVSDDPNLHLTFSTDAVTFDTVFTGVGSATLQFIVYNKNANALIISRIWQDVGEDFKVNVDGEADLSQATDWQLRGGDSLIVFVKVNIDPTSQNAPLFVHDNLNFAVNGNVQTVSLEAYGQNVHLIKTKKRLTVRDNFIFTADKPYLIYDTLAISSFMHFDAGARLYFHNDAVILSYGDVEAKGTLAQPVVLQGDRTDNLYDSVPYAFVAGMWGGVYLIDSKDSPAPKTYNLDYVDILSANVGLFCVSDRSADLPQLTNSRIHNHAVYGLVLQNTNANVVNSEISNAAAYCVYLSGGKQRFVHSTIASYFNSTDVRIQSTPREDVAAVYINNVSKNNIPTMSSFRNCIVTGVRQNNFLLATPLPKYYEDTIANNYLKADSLDITNAKNNVYWTKNDTAVFRNTYYKYKEYHYYDFQLDSLSPARGIGDSLVALSCPLDRLGQPRVRFEPGDTIRPDAGCYQYK